MIQTHQEALYAAGLMSELVNECDFNQDEINTIMNLL